MSSNIKIQRVCQHCGKDFIARTTVTQYCSDTCSKRAYKARIREAKVDVSNMETQLLKNRPIEELKTKEFLTVKDVATLLNCSVRSVYNHIESGSITATNLGQRITRIKRSELDKLFEKPLNPTPQATTKTVELNISECYTIGEVQTKFNISDSALNNIIKRNGIPKIKKGWFTYVRQSTIDKILS